MSDFTPWPNWPHRPYTDHKAACLRRLQEMDFTVIRREQVRALKIVLTDALSSLEVIGDPEEVIWDYVGYIEEIMSAETLKDLKTLEVKHHESK